MMDKRTCTEWGGDRQREMNKEVEQKKGVGRMNLLGCLYLPPKCSKVIRYGYTECPC
jgi:hypothetical protein